MPDCSHCGGKKKTCDSFKDGFICYMCQGETDTCKVCPDYGQCMAHRIDSLGPDDPEFISSVQANYFMLKDFLENLYWKAQSMPRKKLKTYVTVNIKKVSNHLDETDILTGGLFLDEPK